MRTPAALALIVVGHPAFFAAIDFDISGVEIDRCRTQQRVHPLRWQPGQHRAGHSGHPLLHRGPLLSTHPPGQPRSSGRTQPRHWTQQMASRIRAVPV